jgi:hypothetical protein
MTCAKIVRTSTRARAQALHLGTRDVELDEGGPDEDADTTNDNAVFATQGVFVP